MLTNARVTAVAILSALLVSKPVPAGACVCYESEGLTADFRDAAAVFAGRVVALAVAQVKVGGHLEEEMVATLRVERRWKGPRDAFIRIHTCGTQTMLCTCGTDFQLGAHFVVFAVGKPLGTGSCQRTRSYTPVPGEPGLEWLGAEDLVRELGALAEGRN